MMMYDYEKEKDYERIPERMWRRYSRAGSCVFKGTQDEYGEFSNMASGFPLKVVGHTFGSAEALYQACRYPHMPDIQAKIASAKNGMQAKMFAKPWRTATRNDWLEMRVKIMKWILRLKASQYPKEFGLVLVETGSIPIVEESSRDIFWGARRVDAEYLEGANVLGRLLMELRDDLQRDEELSVAPPNVGILLMGRPVRS